ncbi:tRNA lysidine(34) synthetase TilS [Siculibacillus lacustris]|uniref:tRNA lysidine(34) synthetase TilS n=1 Tax=Siculibacillus lacustris TaxID=1549641 RepID=UPI0013F17725|nr:tRNA lysidine(34) synthetase TilS [Siculibacillus lacustris]
MSSADDAPVSDREAAQLFAPLRDRAGVALGVSGGADSSALLHLWARARTVDPALPPAMVLSVDHRLRAESATEAAIVAARAAALGLPHQTLAWTGPKPAGDLQASARRARRALMRDALEARGWDTLVLAHHADDQAETFLARLARGSGVVGLAAMAPLHRAEGMWIARPFLALPKRRLTATLTAAGIDWIEDPSNADRRFDRARWRAAMPDLAALGLTRERLVATARAMARAAVALDGLGEALTATAEVVHPAGWTTLDAATWAAAPEEIRLRCLSRAIARVGGGDYGPRLDDVERLDAALIGARAGGSALVRTLGGVRIELRRGLVWLAPEEGRVAAPIELRPGASAWWAGRRLRLAWEAPGMVTVGLLGEAGRGRLDSAAWGRASAPSGVRPSAKVIAAATALSVDGRLVAVPGLGWRAPDAVHDWSGALFGADCAADR